MSELFIDLFDSNLMLRINAVIGFLLLAVFVFFFFSKEGRDERGRNIIATASLISYFALFILLNILPLFVPWLMDNYVRLMNGIQFTYSLFLFIADISLIIIRKVR